MRQAFNPEVTWAALLRGLVPGWGHLHIGQRWVAAVGVAVWTVLFLAGLASAGGPLAWFCFFALIGWHGFLISLLLSRPLAAQPLFRRAEVGLLVFGVLSAGIYLPGRWALRNLAVAVHLDGLRRTQLLQNGDTLVCTGAWTTPGRWQRGDLVIYRIPTTTVPGAVIRRGLGIDRIVALPGDVVVLQNGSVTINGRAVEPGRGPIAPITWPLEGEMVVPEGTCFILPSALRLDANGAAAHQLIPQVALAASMVRQSDIVGRAWWRLRPWGRFGGIGGDAP